MVLVLRMFLGLWLALSSLAKLSDWAGFRRGLREYRLGQPRLMAVAGWCLPWLELATALALLAGWSVWLAAVAVVVMLGVFSLAIAVNLHRGLHHPCYCHGTRRPQPISVGTLARNAWLVACALALFLAADGPFAAQMSPSASLSPVAAPIPQVLLVVWLWLTASLLEAAVGVLSRRWPKDVKSS